MDWLWDPKTQEEVCFTADGREYMRYNRRTKKYRYPDPDWQSWSQQIGFSEAIPLAQHLGAMSVEESKDPHLGESSSLQPRY